MDVIINDDNGDDGGIVDGIMMLKVMMGGAGANRKVRVINMHLCGIQMIPRIRACSSSLTLPCAPTNLNY